MATKTEPASDREILVERLIEGPRALVFEAFSKAEHLNQWFGPNGFRNTTTRFQFEPGGVWEFVMHGPDGTDYPNYIEYQEIVRPERLVLLHGERAGDPNAFVSTFTFVERGRATLVRMLGTFKSKARRDEVIEKFGALEGGKQTLGRLAAHVADLAKAKES